MAALELVSVSAGYNRRVVLESLTLKLDSGFYVVLGPNGAGKTTLLRLCAGVIQPYAGQVLLDGADINENVEIKKRIGYLSHRDSLYPNLTTRQNLTFYCKSYGLQTCKGATRISELSKTLDFGDLLERRVATLSHGQKQRVAIARTLLSSPDILLLDEPTTGLDPYSAGETRRKLRALANSLVVYATHNVYEAAELGEKILIINNREIVFQATSEEIQKGVGDEAEIGFRTMSDPRQVFLEMGYSPNQKQGLWVVRVRSSSELSSLVNELASAKVGVIEVKQMENALEALLYKLRGK